MRNMASLLSKPMTPAPPDDDASGGEPAGSGGLQSLMGQQGSRQGGQSPAPNFEQTVAALNHLTEFEHQWRKVLDNPDAGKKDIKGDVMEALASVMGDGYITLAQTMSLLKDLPTTPLEQKQWVQEHYRKDVQAQTMLLQHHAAAFPLQPGDPSPPEGTSSLKSGNHPQMMSELVAHYKSRSGKGGR